MSRTAIALNAIVRQRFCVIVYIHICSNSWENLGDTFPDTTGGALEKGRLVRPLHSYSTETLVRQKANGSFVDALPDTCTSTLLNSVLGVANSPRLFQHVVLN